MSLLWVRGMVEAPSSHSAGQAALKSLVGALSVRFDRVQTQERSITASASSLRTLVMRGPRSHPMLAFDRVHVELVDGSPKRLSFALSIKMQVVIYSYVAIGGGLILSVSNGLARGLTTGVLFGASVFLLNYFVARHRAVDWLSKTWTEAIP
jgi:hypothetical protein